MTTIVYRGGVLAADRKMKVTFDESSEFFMEADKLKIHPSRRLAYCITGDVTENYDDDKFGDYLVQLVTDYLKDPTARVSRAGVKNMFSDCSSPTILIMTKPVSLMISMDADYAKNLDKLPFFTAGSGMYAALPCLIENKPLKKLFEIVSKVDFGTSSKFNSIKRGKLLKF